MLVTSVVKNPILLAALVKEVVSSCLVSSCIYSLVCIVVCMCGEGVATSGPAPLCTYIMVTLTSLITLWPPVDLTSYTHLFMLAFRFAEEPSIDVTPKWGSRFTGETFNLTAVVGGHPLPTTITIKKLENGHPVDYPKTKYTVTNLSRISIHDLSLEDNGEYRAYVESLYNTMQYDTFTIVVKGNNTNYMICYCSGGA